MLMSIDVDLYLLSFKIERKAMPMRPWVLHASVGTVLRKHKIT